MKKIVFLCSAISLFFLTSCMEKVGNSQEFRTNNAVVRYYADFPGITFLNTPYGAAYGAIAAPELNGKAYKNGDCLLVSFTIDFDNQPSSKYTSASSIQHEKIGKTDIVMLDASGSRNIGDIIDELSVDSIKELGFPGEGYYCIDNNLFMGFYQLDAKVQNYEYQLVYSDSLVMIFRFYMYARRNQVCLLLLLWERETIGIKLLI